MATDLGFGLAATLAGMISGKLLAEKDDDPLTDEKPTTLSTKGSFTPHLIGTGRVAPVFAWADNRTVSSNEAGAGGKGSAPDTGDTIYREEGWHILGVGPCQRLIRIYKNGNIIYEPNGDTGIGPNDLAAGTPVVIPDYGTFQFWWGTQDQATNGHLNTASPNNLGILSQWPWMIQVVWTPARLGGFPSWQGLEYEIEVWPLRASMWTEAGNTAGSVDPLDTVTYPTALTQSDPAYRADQILPARALLGVHNATPSQGGPSVTLRVQGDRSTDFDPGASVGIVDLVGQPNASADRRYEVASAVFQSGTDPFVGTAYNGAASPVLWDFSHSDWVKVDGASVAVESGLPSPTGITLSQGYRLSKTLGAFDPSDFTVHSRVSFYMGSTADPNFDDEWGRSVKVFVHEPWESRGTGQSEARVDLFLFTHNTDAGVGNGAYFETKFTFTSPDSVQIVRGDSGGAIGRATQAGNGWWKLEIFMHVGDGYPRPTTSTPWSLGIRFGQPHPAAAPDETLVIMTPKESPLSAFSTISLPNPGEVQTSVGTTLITLNEDVTNLYGHRGTAAGSRMGSGPWGFNAAHILYHLLFETAPHGAGRDISLYDLDSLEEVGQRVGNLGERLLSHSLAVGGESYDKTIAAIMTDLGLLMPWDVTLGKYVFKLVREEDPADVAEISDDWVLPNLPEVDTHHRPSAPNKLQFGYSKRPKYRDEPITFDDDGRALLGISTSSVQPIPIYTATDPLTAAKIAARRAGEVLTIGSKYKISLQKGARELKAGDVRTFGAATGIEEDLRIVSVQPSVKSSKVQVEATTDTYALSAEEPIVVPDPPGAAAATASASWDLLELPAVLCEGRVAAWVPFDHLNSATTGGNLWLSQDDSEYILSSSRTTAAIYGSYEDDFGASDTQSPALGIPRGVEVQALGDDAWRAGRLTAVITSPAGVEYCFFKQLDLDVDFPWLFRASGLIRGRLGSVPLDHSGEGTVWILDYRTIQALTDPLVRLDQITYAKTALRSLTGTTSIAGAEAKTLTPVGGAVRPGDPTWFLPEGRVLEWRLGAGVTFQWAAKHEAGRRSRTGAGYQTPGTLVVPQPGPEVEVRFLTTGEVLKRTLTVSGDYSCFYSSGSIDADFGAGTPFLAEIQGTHPSAGPAIRIRLEYRA